MARIHNLDIYACTGTRNCLGCVNDLRVDGAPDTDPEPKPPPPDGAERGYAGRRSEPDADPLPGAPAPRPLPPVLFGAHWSTATTAVAQAVRLYAFSSNLPADAVATVCIEDDAGAAVDAFRTSLDDGALDLGWTPSEPGRFTFRVEVGPVEAVSGTLDVRGWIEIMLRSESGDALVGAGWRLLTRDGEARDGVSDTSGRVRVLDLPGEAVWFEVVSLGERTAQRAATDASTPTGSRHSVALGDALELATRTRHVVEVATGLVLAFHRPMSRLAGHGGAIIVCDSDGVELARRSIEEDALPQGPSVALELPEVPLDADITVIAVSRAGARHRILSGRLAASVDARTRLRCESQVAEGEVLLDAGDAYPGVAPPANPRSMRTEAAA